MFVIKFKKEISAISIVLLSLFTLAGCENKKEIQIMSEKIAELENSKIELTSEAIELKKNNENLNSEIAGLKESNKDLNSQIIDLKKSNENLNSENKDLKTENENLTKSNTALQKEISDLKKKLNSSESNNQSTNKGSGKIAYLTFDDGPSNNTIKILDILKQYNIKATFFVNGHPEKKAIYNRIINEGHTIGNHTYSHDYSTVYKTIDGFNRDKQKLDNFIFETTGVKPKILRFPGGSNNHVSYNYGGKDFMDKLTKYVKQLGIKYFDWNVSSTDAEVRTQNKDIIISQVLKGAKNKKQAIILMHDSSPKTTTAEALPSIIQGLKDQGFKFAVLSPEVNAIQFK